MTTRYIRLLRILSLLAICVVGVFALAMTPDEHQARKAHYYSCYQKLSAQPPLHSHAANQRYLDSCMQSFNMGQYYPDAASDTYQGIDFGDMF